MAAPLAALAGVGKRYGAGPPALAGVDLSVLPGRVLCLVGPSGCGKSTLLRLLARLDAPSEGELRFDPALDPSRDVGFVFQEPTLMPWATALANAALPLRLRGVPRAAARGRAREALALVGLAAAADLKPRQLSGGMRMRVSIARALATRPRLLLMDEPFAALDEIARERLDDDLLALRAATGCAVVFVTHSVAEACYLGDEVVVMAAGPGRVVARVPVAGARGPAFRAAPAYLAAREAAGRALRAGLRAGDDL